MGVVDALDDDVVNVAYAIDCHFNRFRGFIVARHLLVVKQELQLIAVAESGHL